jgi:hypothetical protein
MHPQSHVQCLVQSDSGRDVECDVTSAIGLVLGLCYSARRQYLNTCKRAVFECDPSTCVDMLVHSNTRFVCVTLYSPFLSPVSASWRGSHSQRLIPECGVEKLRHAKSHLT